MAWAALGGVGRGIALGCALFGASLAACSLLVDTNADPQGVDYIIPGNDDALRAIELYCDLVADAVLDGLQQEQKASGKDLGEAVDVKVELPPESADAKAPANEAAKPSKKKKGAAAAA